MRVSCVFLTAIALGCHYGLVVNALTMKPRNQARHRASGLSSTAESSNQISKDFSGEASGLFGNVRIPAALFAGAAAGAAFAMPLGVNEGLKIGLVKRVYALFMMGALSSQVVAVVVSTLTMGALSTQKSPRSSSSLQEYLNDYYNLEWISARLHFLGGVLLFLVGIGLRAWITISCPIIAKAALGMILSSACLCLSFWKVLEEDSFLDGVVMLPVRYVRAMWQRSQKSSLFGTSLILSAATLLYTLGNIPHIYQYLAL